MFLPPRFVAIDDNPKHLNAILDVFQSLGSPCLGIVFDPAQALEKQRFEGVRGLFLDLHLLDSTVDIDETKARERDFPHIVHILETCISPAGGPFVLVIWTRHAALAEGLGEYLDQNLNPENPHACPLAVTSLPKTDFINADTGEIVPDKAEALRDAVTSAVSEKAQLAALLAWEADVQRAAGATLSAVMELVPDAQRKSTLYASGLDEVLSRLARAAVGRPHVEADPKAAIAAALAPMLTDRVVNQEGLPADTAVWQEALTWEGGEPLDSTRAGKVNRMLHVAIPLSEGIRPTDWGAVVEFPNEWWNDDRLQNLFGLRQNQLLGGEFKIRREDRDRCRPRLVRVGAACDHAQNRRGPVLYLFGLEIDCDIERKPDDDDQVRLPASEWSSPALLLEPDIGPFVLAVNSRYSVSVSPADAAGWQPMYRLREQLVMHLISHAGSYLTRPGIVRF